MPEVAAIAEWPTALGMLNLWELIVDDFRRRGVEFDVSQIMPIVLGAGGIAALLVGATLIDWIAKRRAVTLSWPRLFGELCAAHHLGWGDRARLRKLAVRVGVTPAELFLRPELFEYPAEATDDELDRFHRLRLRLFGD